MINRREFLVTIGLGGTALLLAYSVPLEAKLKKEVMAMPYTAKDYSKLIGIEGFSETLPEESLYPLSGICNEHKQSVRYSRSDAKGRKDRGSGVCRT